MANNIQIHLPVDAADQLLNIVAPPQDEGAAGVWKPDAQNPALSPIQRINAMSPAPRRAFPPVGAAPEVQPSGMAPAPTAAPVNVAAPPHHGFFQRLGGVLGRIGGYGLSAVAPGIAAEIPSTPLGKIAAEHREQERELGQADIAGKQAETGEAQARTDLAKAQTEALKEPKPAAQTPEEQTIHDLMTGNNGQPRINPKTNQPYNYLDAYEAVKQAGERPDKAEKAGEYREYTVPGEKAPVLAREDDSGNLVTREGAPLPAGAQLFQRPQVGESGTWSLQTLYDPQGKPYSVEVNSKSGAVRAAPTSGTKAKPEDQTAKINAALQTATSKIAALDQAHQAGKLDDPSYYAQSVQQWKTYAQEIRRLGQVPTATPELGRLYLQKYGNEAAAEAAMKADGWEIPR